MHFHHEYRNHFLFNIQSIPNSNSSLQLNSHKLNNDQGSMRTTPKPYTSPKKERREEVKKKKKREQRRRKSPKSPAKQPLDVEIKTLLQFSYRISTGFPEVSPLNVCVLEGRSTLAFSRRAFPLQYEEIGVYVM